MSRSERWRKLAAAGLVAASLAAVACGSDDDDGSNGAAGAGGAETSVSPEQRSELTATYDRFVSAIAAHRWRDACDSYSARYVAAYPKQIKLAGNCVETMKLEFSMLSSRSQLPRVYKIEPRGPRAATVVVRNGPNENGTALDLVIEDGGWQIDGPAERSTRWNPKSPNRLR